MHSQAPDVVVRPPNDARIRERGGESEGRYSNARFSDDVMSVCVSDLNGHPTHLGSISLEQHRSQVLVNCVNDVGLFTLPDCRICRSADVIEHEQLAVGGTRWEER